MNIMTEEIKREPVFTGKERNVIGDKVLLRAIEEQDKEMLMNLSSDPEIIKVTGRYSYSASSDYQLSGFYPVSSFADSLHRIIADRNSPRTALGIIILSHMDLKNKAAEIYIKLMKSVRKKGYGQDAVNIMVSYAFHEFGLTCIYSRILEYNTASRRLFEKCGFKQEETYKSRIYRDGCCQNVCIYAVKNSHVNVT